MSVKIKICADCGEIKRIGRSKSRCKSCRKADPKKFLNRPAGSGPKHKKKTECLTIGPFVDWRVCYLPKCVRPQNKSYSTINLGRSQRNFVLKAYGYKSYKDDYLRSDLWQTIRAKVLQGAMCVCGCGRLANLVHHKAYTEANLMGYTLRGLVALHQDCHYKIEFSEDRKCNLGEANSRLKGRQHDNGSHSLPTNEENCIKVPINRLPKVKHRLKVKNKQCHSDQLDFIGDWTVDFSLQPGDVLPGADTA